LFENETDGAGVMTTKLAPKLSKLTWSNKIQKSTSHHLQDII